jgi:DNA-binding NtrC family response regulator
MNQPVIDIEACQSHDNVSSSILIVEGGQDIPSDPIRRLRSQGVAVDMVDGVEDALRMVTQQHYALAMIDSDVDGRQGMELLECMLKDAPDLPIVLTTAAASVRHAVEAMQKGAVDYLMKPVSAEAFENCVLHFISSNTIQTLHRNEAPLCNDNPFITNCPVVKNILETGRSVAGSQATVLITGESGTGKEVLASYIHRHSCRNDAPYVAVNCAALPDTLMESELFGYEKGAFTGANNRKIGKFEQAGKGTLVLDEISEMPLTLQAKLLRVLQERRIDRIGSDKQVPFEAQVIAISNRHLGELVRKGQMREDLYYRINVVPLHLPPLRTRQSDIPLLVEHFIQRYSTLYQRQALRIDTAMMAGLERNFWKGNIRELENCIERAVLIGSLPTLNDQAGEDQQITAADPTTMSIRPGLSVRAVEEALIKRTLHEVNDHREQAAKMLGISIRTLRNKLKEYKNRAEEQLEKDPLR